ncbi:putative Bile acid:sodium symporter [Helianthus debilis subsp. tardiflorus]
MTSIYTNLLQLQLHHHNQQLFPSFPPKPSSIISSTGNRCLGSTVSLRSRSLVVRCVSSRTANPFDSDEIPEYAPKLTQKSVKTRSVLEVWQNANSILPQVVLISTILAFIRPSSFTWFTSR